MALITGLIILNGSDKTRHYTVAMGTGAPTDVLDPLVADVKKYPIGSQYTNLDGHLYVRVAAAGLVADWKLIGPAIV